MECKQLLSSPSLDSPTISHQHNRYHLLWLKIFYIRCIDTSNQALVSAHTSLQLSPQSFTVPPHSPLNMASPVPSTPSTPTNKSTQSTSSTPPTPLSSSIHSTVATDDIESGSCSSVGSSPNNQPQLLQDPGYHRRQCQHLYAFLALLILTAVTNVCIKIWGNRIGSRFLHAAGRGSFVAMWGFVFSLLGMYFLGGYVRVPSSIV